MEGKRGREKEGKEQSREWMEIEGGRKEECGVVVRTQERMNGTAEPSAGDPRDGCSTQSRENDRERAPVQIVRRPQTRNSHCV